MMLRVFSHTKALRNVQKSASVASRFFSTLPEHIVVPMPALSPTMEIGSISNWLLKEGDAFEAGQAICEVETDKATVTYDATDDGYIAKILIGSGDIEVGAPLMITVEDASFVSSFANYVVGSSPAQSSQPVTEIVSHAQPPTPSESNRVPRELNLSTDRSGRVLASPLARRLAREAQVDMARVAGLVPGSGPRGRVVAADVLQALGALQSSPSPAAATAERAAAPAAAASAAVAAPAAEKSVGQKVPASFEQHSTDISGGSVSSALAALSARSKKEVPHYYLSVEIDVSNALSMKHSLGDKNDISLQDILVKAAAKAMEKVPAVNAAWMDSFVRQYEQVDVNLVLGEGASLRAPVLRNVGARGLSSISQEIKKKGADCSDDLATFESGTFTIHNLGMYGVQSSAAIVLPPQACALSFGAVVDTVVPSSSSQEGAPVWKVAPIMVSTLSCDHRVIDGAVGAGWLKAFKDLVENPLTLLL